MFTASTHIYVIHVRKYSLALNFQPLKVTKKSPKYSLCCLQGIPFIFLSWWWWTMALWIRRVFPTSTGERFWPQDWSCSSGLLSFHREAWGFFPVPLHLISLLSFPVTCRGFVLLVTEAAVIPACGFCLDILHFPMKLLAPKVVFCRLSILCPIPWFLEHNEVIFSLVLCPWGLL